MASSFQQLVDQDCRSKPFTAIVMNKNLNSMAGGLFLSLVGVVFALVIAEFAVRIYYGFPFLPLIPPEPYIDNELLYQRTPSRLYELRPNVESTVGTNQVDIRTNAAGFRDNTDYPMAKPSGTYRIVVLGDSFAFAGKVPLSETFPKRLETMLNQHDPSHHYQVLNLAVPGYNGEQEMLMLKEKGLAYQPDLVIVSFPLVDVRPMGQLGRISRIPLPMRQVLKRFYLVQFLYARYRQISSIAKNGSFKGNADVAALADGTPGWESAESALVEMDRMSTANNARMLVTIWPVFVNLDSGYPYKAKHALVMQACQSAGIPALDLLPTFLGQRASALWVAGDDQHPNSRAQQMAAQAIFEELVAADLIRSGTSR
jgi:hypothetical protein